MAKAKPRGRSSSGKRRAPAKRRPPARTRRVGQTSRQALSPHKGDIQGVAMILLGVLFALSVWAHDGGLAGRFIELLLRNLLGWGAYAVPLLVAGVGLALFRRAARGDDESAGGRAAIGLTAVLVGGLGLVHLAKGAPPRTAEAILLQHSGGLLGAVTATPLAGWLSAVGASASVSVSALLPATGSKDEPIVAVLETTPVAPAAISQIDCVMQITTSAQRYDTYSKAMRARCTNPPSAFRRCSE